MSNAVLTTRQKLALEQDFSDVRVGGYIAELEKAGDISSRRMIIELMGSDGIRDYEAMRLMQLSVALLKPAERFTRATVRGISKKDAIRIYSLFPRFITPTEVRADCREELNELSEISKFYLESSLWLMNWQKSSKYTDSLNILLGEFSSKRARVAQTLYILCDYIRTAQAHPYINELSTPVLWLLCEISICKRRMLARPMQKSKAKLAKERSEIFKRLDSADPSEQLNDRESDNLTDLAEHFYEFILYLGKKMAKSDKDFDKVALKPHIAAQAAWSWEARNGTKITGFL